MEIIKKHIITILCVLSILLLALPIASVEVSIESEWIGSIDSEATVSGFNALGNSLFAYILLIGPALLVAMNYIKQLEKYKGILAIAIPIVCLISLIIVIISAKSFSTSASAGDYASTEAKIKIGIGAMLLFLTYIGTVVAGAVTYHNLTLDKAGLEKLKDSATNIMNVAQDKISNIKIDNKADNLPVDNNVSNATESAPKTQVRKSTNIKHIEEVLELLERLAKMKDSGILSEEEFVEKKKQFLEEI